MEQKPKMFNINNFVTSESARLTSLSLKRDLNLGGNKQKKVYKPNLNVVRNKNKGKIFTNNKSQSNQKKHGNKSHTATKNNQSQRYIQSTSVFSEGAGDLKRPSTVSLRYPNHGERDPTAMAMPKVIKPHSGVNYKEEKTVVDDLLAECEDSTSESEDDYSPVILPLKNNKAGFLKTYQIKKEDPDKDVKEEEEASAVNNTPRTSGDISHDVPLSFQNIKLYDDDHPCISLVRLPDSLPGKGFTEGSDKITDFDLNQMVEGRIGKVLVRKSGKVEVQIGHMKYLLDPTESNPFKEDVMYIPEDLKSSSFGPDMANLGSIDEKYVLCPSWKHLFDLQNSKKNKN